MNKPKVTVIGSINMDLVTETVKVPTLGETVIGKQFTTIPGGKGANQAVAAARLGAEVTMIGAVGDDAFGGELTTHLKNEGINVNHVEPITEISTGIASITIADKDNSIIVVPGANYQLTEDKIDKLEEVIANSDIILLQLEIPMATVERAVEIAKKHKVKVILNPAPAQALSEKLIDMIDYITPNEHELAFFYDTQNEKVEDLINRVGEKFIVTKGSKGVYFYQDGKEVHVPGFSVDVVDTTGAGDSFNGALAVALSKAYSLEQACHYGNAVGALSVTKFGAQTGMPTDEEVKYFIQQQEKE